MVGDWCRLFWEWNLIEATLPCFLWLAVIRLWTDSFSLLLGECNSRFRSGCRLCVPLMNVMVRLIQDA